MLKLELPVAVEEGEELLQKVSEGLLLGLWLPEPEAVAETLPAALAAARVALGLPLTVAQPLLLPELLWLPVLLAEKEELTELEEL